MSDTGQPPIEPRPGAVPPIIPPAPAGAPAPIFDASQTGMPQPGYATPLPGYNAPPGPATPGYTAPPAAPLPGYAPTPPEQHTNVLAIVSLASAFIVSLAGIITGHIALSQIRRTGEKGHGLALAGVIVGYARLALDIVVGVIIVVAIVAGIGSARDHGGVTPGGGSGGSGGSGGTSDTAAGDITWDAGQTLDAASVPQISDGLQGDPGWRVATLRDSSGTWSYDSADQNCTATLHQGPLDRATVVVTGDDQATTDNYISSFAEIGAADMAQYATDDYIGLGMPDAENIVQTRIIDGSLGDSGESGSFATTARAFGTLQRGVSIDVQCTDDSALDSLYDVVSKSAVVIG